MKKRLLYVVPIVLVALAAAAWRMWPETKVRVKTGTIVMCTWGELISDDTRETQVTASEVGEHGVRTEVTTCDRHKRIEELRKKAEEAIRDKDLAAARLALEELVKLDPSDSGSAQKLKAVVAGKIPAGGSSGGGSGSGNGGGGDNGGDNGDGGDGGGSNGGGNGGERPPEGPVANLTDYVPDKLTGFVAQGIVADPFILWRNYIPEGKSPILQLVVMAEQHGSKSDSEAAIARDVKTYYPDDARSVDVKGRTAYFGTRRHLAVLALSDGSIRLVLEMASDDVRARDLLKPLTGAAVEILR
ncbi:MAG: hypothetical protein IBX62_08925 [Coriobacteriia bacterium]|nr:hypothetical protein [Coriobacteriia bacterium]